MIIGINESKTLTKHISRKCKCKSDGRKYNSNQWRSNNKCKFECKKRHVCGKDYIWNLVTCSCKNVKDLASIMDDSAITCDEIIDAEANSNDEETEIVPANFNEKIAAYKTRNFYILLAFLLITIILLIAVITYCYLIKYRAKQIYYHFASEITN